MFCKSQSCYCLYWWRIRSEDRRVTNQLELAARKLTALSEEEAAQVYEEEMQLADQTANVAKQNGTLWVNLAKQNGTLWVNLDEQNGTLYVNLTKQSGTL